MSCKTRSARADRSIVHTWDLGMPSEAEPYTLVQVTRRRALGCTSPGATTSAQGHGQTAECVRGDDSFPRKPSLGAPTEAAIALLLHDASILWDRAG
jgi:hypothetical protein